MSTPTSEHAKKAIEAFKKIKMLVLLDDDTEATMAIAQLLADGEAKAVIMPMKLSDGTTDYFVRIERGDKRVEVHTTKLLNRAHYTADGLNHVLNGGPEPDLMNDKYADPEQSQ